MQLFICYTPLQILVANQIIGTEKIKNYNFIYLYDNISDKNTHYYNLLRKNAVYSNKLLRTKNIFTDFKHIYHLYLQLKKETTLDNVTIYTGNIKSVHTRFLMLLLNYSTLNTFDDGCGNVVAHGYYADNSEILLYKLFFSLVKPKLVYKNLRKTMKTHFSIYKEKNIYPNVKHIDLFDNIPQHMHDQKPTKVIFLTSVLSEDKIISLEQELALYTAIISKFTVTDIISHPRERNPKITNNIELISTNRISEEEIFKLSKDFELTVIGIFSATLLNISGLNIAKKLISIDFENSHINKELIDIFKKRNIECYKYNPEENKNSMRRL